MAAHTTKKNCSLIISVNGNIWVGIKKILTPRHHTGASACQEPEKPFQKDRCQ